MVVACKRGAGFHGLTGCLAWHAADEAAHNHGVSVGKTKHRFGVGAGEFDNNYASHFEGLGFDGVSVAFADFEASWV